MRRSFLSRFGLFLLALVLVLFGLCCSDPEIGGVTGTEENSDFMTRFVSEPLFDVPDEIARLKPPRASERQAFFGDLHVHTTYSFDAYAFGTLATPSDAYRYARGEAIAHPGGFDMKLRQPLDFYAVTDHAMFLGTAQAAGDTSTAFSKLEVAKPLNDLNAKGNFGITSLLPRTQAFSNFLPDLADAIRSGEIEREVVLDITRSAWSDIVDAAERYNEPGRFTTFIAFEYTSSTDDRGNLHRNVIFRDGEQIPSVPFSRFHSQNPEGLWDWMDRLRARGVESLAIPHNSNGSNGQMFRLEDWAGNPIDDAYAERRLRNEPLVEITQVKGTSETHPSLSTRDEWADFEIMPYRVATMLPSEPSGSYVRQALQRGLAFERKGIANPYAFGLIGSSDTHTGATSDDESNYFAKLGLLDATPQLRGSVPLSFLFSAATRFFAPQLREEIDGEPYLKMSSPTYSASGLAAVWAEENTREAIYDAFRRKETFATSGPRMQLRFFGGYGFSPDLLEASDAVARAYTRGVSMGGELPSRATAPSFLLWALADAQSAPLQRLQIVKGWVDSSGETGERVYDVACSDEDEVDPRTHRCPDNGARVDLSDCSITRRVGASQLRALWKDPDHNASQRAFYYARVLENPTCRWSTWDALREGVPPRPDLPKTLQERAWSSPIWVRPAAAS